MRWTQILKGLTAAAIAGTGGCTVGPDYHPNPPPVPAAWSSTPANGLTAITAAESAWWTSFNDAELDSLIQRAAQSNLDLLAAEARLRQARAVREMGSADLWPTLDASGSAARAKQSKHQPLIGALPLPPNFPFEYSVYQAGFDASWEVDLFGAKRGRGGGDDGAAGVWGRSGTSEIDSVEALPTGGFDKGGERVDVAGRDLADGLTGSRRGPDVAVDGVAADPQDARTDELEEGDEIGICAGEEVGIFVESAFFVGESGEGGANGQGSQRQQCEEAEVFHGS